jgi:hypothetical protein
VFYARDAGSLAPSLGGERVLLEIAIRKGPRNIVAHDSHALEPV